MPKTCRATGRPGICAGQREFRTGLKSALFTLPAGSGRDAVLASPYGGRACRRHVNTARAWRLRTCGDPVRAAGGLLLVGVVGPVAHSARRGTGPGLRSHLDDTGGRSRAGRGVTRPCGPQRRGPGAGTLRRGVRRRAARAAAGVPSSVWRGRAGGPGHPQSGDLIRGRERGRLPGAAAAGRSEPRSTVYGDRNCSRLTRYPCQPVGVVVPEEHTIRPGPRRRRSRAQRHRLSGAGPAVQGRASRGPGRGGHGGAEEPLMVGAASMLAMVVIWPPRRRARLAAAKAPHFLSRRWGHRPSGGPGGEMLCRIAASRDSLFAAYLRTSPLDDQGLCRSEIAETLVRRVVRNRYAARTDHGQTGTRYAVARTSLSAGQGPFSGVVRSFLGERAYSGACACMCVTGHPRVRGSMTSRRKTR